MELTLPAQLHSCTAALLVVLVSEGLAIVLQCNISISLADHA